MDKRFLGTKPKEWQMIIGLHGVKEVVQLGAANVRTDAAG